MEHAVVLRGSVTSQFTSHLCMWIVNKKVMYVLSENGIAPMLPHTVSVCPVQGLKLLKFKQLAHPALRIYQQ